jgi:hypothetical protein
MRKLGWVLAMALCVAAAVATGESQAQLLGKAPGTARSCVNLGCTSSFQCSPACGPPGSAVCVSRRCVPI